MRARRELAPGQLGVAGRDREVVRIERGGAQQRVAQDEAARRPAAGPLTELELEQEGAPRLAVRVDAARARDAAVERAGEDEVERADPGQLVTAHLAVEQRPVE